MVVSVNEAVRVGAGRFCLCSGGGEGDPPIFEDDIGREKTGRRLNLRSPMLSSRGCVRGGHPCLSAVATLGHQKN